MIAKLILLSDFHNFCILIYNSTSQMTDIECVRNQNDEFKALSCIYLDELHVIKESAPHKFGILCKPYIGNQF